MSTRTRKTIDVAKFVTTTNRFLASHVDSAERKGMCMAIEHVLHMANAYRGFTYLPSEYAQEGEETVPGSVLRAGYDEYRRAYHLPTEWT